MGRRDFIWYSLLATAVPAGWGTALLFGMSKGSDAVAARPFEVVAREGDLAFGNPGAAAAILACVSLTCPHCRAWEEGEMPALLAGPVASGKARLVLRDFPLDAAALAGAGVVRCLPEARKAAAHFSLMRSSERWAASGARGAADMLAALMPDAAPDPATLAARAMSRAVQDDVLASSLDATARYGIRATPTFVAGRHVRSGGIPAATLEAWLAPGA